MDYTDRYDIISDEAKFELASSNEILKNKLGFSSIEQIELHETQRLTETLYALFEKYSGKQQFTTNDICSMHKLWLGDLYSWAGKYRSVNMSKEGFSFAAAYRIPALMNDFEKNILAKYTPCNFEDIDSLIEALAITHVEFILIHPFRDGNGRLGRLLMTLMATQSRRKIIDFNQFTYPNYRTQYFSAIQHGLSQNYQPLIKLIKQIIEI